MEKEQEIWAVVTNTDLTEGKGSLYVVCSCQLWATAERISAGKGVQGADAEVMSSIAIRDTRSPTGWLVPGNIQGPTREDTKRQEILDDRQKAIEAARKAGLSNEQINLIATGWVTSGRHKS